VVLRRHAWLACVFVVSLSVRVAWVSQARVTPITDFRIYDRLAMGVLRTGEYGGGYRLAYRPPGYPLFLAGVYGVFGHSYPAAGYAAAVLGALSSALVATLGARAVSRRTGVIAGLLHALSPTALAYTPLLATENLAVPLVLMTTVLLAGADSGGRQARPIALAGLSGIACGLLLLVRPAGLFFVPAWALLALYSFMRRQWRPWVALAFLGATAGIVGPWLMRNQRLLGAATLGTNGGGNLLMANNDLAVTGGTYEPALRPYRNLPELESDRRMKTEALAWICTHPGRYLLLCGVRAVRLLGTSPDPWAGRYLCPTAEHDALITRSHDGRLAADVDLDNERRLWDVRHANDRVLAGVRVAIAPLVLVALALSAARWRALAIVGLPALCYLGGLSATFVQERFRELADPLLAIPLAALVGDIVAGGADLGPRPRRWVKGIVALALVGAVALLHVTGRTEGWYRLSGPAVPETAERPDTDGQTALSVVRLAEPATQSAAERGRPVEQ